MKTGRGAVLWMIPLVGLLWWAGSVTDWGRALIGPAPQIAAVSPRMSEAGLLPDLALSTDATPYKEIAERPLFAPWRRVTPPAPPPVVAAEPPKPNMRKGLYQLTGVTQSGDTRFAMVKEVANNRTRIVRSGDSLQELKVERIDDDRIVLAFQGETDEISLAKFTASGRTAPSSTPQVAIPQSPTAAAVPAPAPSPVPGAAPPAPAAAPNAVARPPVPNVPSVPQAAAPAAPTSQPPGANTAAAGNTVPAAIAPAPEIISVGELLERRRRARQQQGGG